MHLLISVVNETEAKAAACGNADIVDVKNPKEGALGANFPHIIKGVRQVTPSQLPVSVAIGDAPDKPGATALAALGAAVCGAAYVKVGLYGTPTPDRAEFLLKGVCKAVRDHDADIKIIAAAYADAHLIKALPALELPFVAKAAGANGCIIDTAVKDGSTLFTHLSDDKLRAFVKDCSRLKLTSALAGSLKASDIPRLSRIAPDIIGFRGAACTQGDRVEGVVQRRLVEELSTLTASHGFPK